MKLLDLTPQQLKRAATIKEQIDALNKELSRLLDDAPQTKSAPARKRLSAKARRNIAAAQQARWAKFRANKKSPPTAEAAKKTKNMGTAAGANLSSKRKARRAAKKAAKK